MITIDDFFAFSTDPLTDISIDFPGRDLVPTTDFRPAVDVDAELPPGVNKTFGTRRVRQLPPSASELEEGTQQILHMGPIKVEQLRDGITLKANVTDPEGSDLKYFWSVDEDPLSGARHRAFGHDTHRIDSRLRIFALPCWSLHGLSHRLRSVWVCSMRAAGSSPPSRTQGPISL